MEDEPDYGIVTRSKHAGHEPDEETGLRAPPIYQSRDGTIVSRPRKGES